MDIHKRSVQIGFCVLVFALTLRVGGALAGKVAGILSKEKVANAIFFLETGRVVRAAKPSPTTPSETEPPAPTEPEPTAAVFTSSDISRVQLNNRTGVSVDSAALMQQTLSWDLTQAAPTVLIYHTHGTEGYSEISGYRTKDKNNNMVSIGAAVARRLEAEGITVLHDTAAHDDPSYNGSYTSSRKSVQAYLAEYPSICLVLDIHRDAVEDEAGNQVGQAITVDGQKTAQLMMVVGTDASGRNHPDWEKNMALAVKLHVQLQKQTPGICRAISFRTQRFNQDLSPGGLLIEVGAAGNTRQEALLAAEKLAEGIIALAEGTEVY